MCSHLIIIVVVVVVIVVVVVVVFVIIAAVHVVVVVVVDVIAAGAGTPSNGRLRGCPTKVFAYGGPWRCVLLVAKPLGEVPLRPGDCFLETVTGNGKSSTTPREGRWSLSYKGAK